MRIALPTISIRRFDSVGDRLCPEPQQTPEGVILLGGTWLTQYYLLYWKTKMPCIARAKHGTMFMKLMFAKLN